MRRDEAMAGLPRSGVRGVLLAALIGWPAMVAAQATEVPAGREVLLGVTGGGKGQPPDAREPRADDAAAGELERAEAELKTGALDAARRRLELLIAKHPDSEVAALARDLLLEIYATQRAAKANRPPSVTPPAPVASARQPEAAPPPPSDAPPPVAPLGGREPALLDATGRPSPAAPTWQAKRRPAERDIEQFRHTAGDRIFFSEGSADLGGRARQVLAAQALWLVQNTAFAITIEAHADELGTRDYNREIAARRAEAVRARLIAEGVEPQRIRILARGKEEPVALCDEPSCAAQNRRAVTRLGWPETQSQQALDGTATKGVAEPRAVPYPPAGGRGRDGAPVR